MFGTLNKEEKHLVAKKPLSMFYVEIKPDVNNKQIYNIKHLLQCKVNFELPHRKREIPQCANCRRYGHTRSFCFRKSRCVKCAEEHSTSNCLRKVRFADVSFAREIIPLTIRAVSSTRNCKKHLPDFKKKGASS